MSPEVNHYKVRASGADECASDVGDRGSRSSAPGRTGIIRAIDSHRNVVQGTTSWHAHSQH
jgi:hypothetical protein